MLYAYIRVSTDSQSVENQRFAIEEYCRQNSLSVSKWVGENISGKVVAKKRLLGGLMSTLRKGDTLICSEVSRLGRDMLMVMGILNDCACKGVKIIGVKGNFRLENTLLSKIFAMAYSISSELERDFISQRTKDALARKKAQGVKLGRPTGAKNKKYKLSGKEQQIRDLIKNKTPVAQIARILKVGKCTVWRFIKEMNS
jgi:DNA invertase Pin-like site-specific DNA recombinase